MANILVYALHYDGAINKNSLGAVSEGAKLAAELAAASHGLASAAGSIAGAKSNGGCSTVVYTNPNPTPYEELECFGPLTNLLAGQTMSFVTTYTLFNRTENDPEAEGRKILGLPAR